VPGAAGGGNVVDAVTFPDGAGWSGAGCSFIEEKRVLEQPAASSAASETAMRPVFEKAITPSVGHPSAPQDQSSVTIKLAKVAKFQPDMVKIRFATGLLQKYLNNSGRRWAFQPSIARLGTNT
jgi:hypothetical protein